MTARAIPYPKPQLRGDSIILRRLEPSDYRALKAARDHPDSVRWVNAVGPPDGDALAAFAETQRRAGKFLHLAIADATDDRFLGEAILFLRTAEVAQSGIGELAYVVDPAARGRGLAAVAVRLLGDWALAALELERLQLSIHPENHASRRVAEKAGFRYEGILRSVAVIRGVRVDSAIYSRLRVDG